MERLNSINMEYPLIKYNNTCWTVGADFVLSDITVSKGYCTNFKSVPWYLNPFGKLSAVLLLHDWLYTTKNSYKRRYVDKLLLSNLLAYKVNKTKAKVIYLLFRLTGWISFEKQ